MTVHRGGCESRRPELHTEHLCQWCIADQCFCPMHFKGIIRKGKCDTNQDMRKCQPLLFIVKSHRPKVTPTHCETFLLSAHVVVDSDSLCPPARDPTHIAHGQGPVSWSPRNVPHGKQEEACPKQPAAQARLDGAQGLPAPGSGVHAPVKPQQRRPVQSGDPRKDTQLGGGALARLGHQAGLWGPEAQSVRTLRMSVEEPLFKKLRVPC